MECPVLCALEHEVDGPREIWNFVVASEPLLRRRVRAVLRNAADVEDAVAEIGLRLFELIHAQPHRLAAIGNVEAWLTQVARNYCIDRVRGQGAMLPYEDNEAMALYECLQNHRGPEQETATWALLTRVLRALDQLPESWQQALKSRCYGEEYEAIASLNHCTTDNARKRVQLARRELKRLLGGSDWRDLSGA